MKTLNWLGLIPIITFADFSKRVNRKPSLTGTAVSAREVYASGVQTTRMTSSGTFIYVCKITSLFNFKDMVLKYRYITIYFISKYVFEHISHAFNPFN